MLNFADLCIIIFGTGCEKYLTVQHIRVMNTIEIHAYGLKKLQIQLGDIVFDGAELVEVK